MAVVSMYPLLSILYSSIFLSSFALFCNSTDVTFALPEIVLSAQHFNLLGKQFLISCHIRPILFLIATAQLLGFCEKKNNWKSLSKSS